MFNRVILFLSILFFIATPAMAIVDENAEPGPPAAAADVTDAAAREEIFKAEVVEILEEDRVERENGSDSIRQKVRLAGLYGRWQGEEVVFDGTRLDVLSAAEYEVGDKVMVSRSLDPEGNENFYIVGFARGPSLFWLAVLFAVLVIAVGRFKGLRALIVLALSFVIILWFIIPRIMAGNDPLFISILGSLGILVLAIYLTEGFNRLSSIMVGSVVLALIATGVLSIWFTGLTNLTGFASEEAMYLVGLSENAINIRGLLLAGIIIGALGVLDDVIVSQVMLVRELKAARPTAKAREIYKQAMRVGTSHLSSMVNTLFLAYAGASLPLLMLFTMDIPPYLSFAQTVNNEAIATEIVRSLAGSIGLVLSVPLSTLLAVKFVRLKKGEENSEKLGHIH